MSLIKEQEKTARKITKMLKGEFLNDPETSPALKMLTRLFNNEVRDPGKNSITNVGCGALHVKMLDLGFIENENVVFFSSYSKSLVGDLILKGPFIIPFLIFRG